MDAFRSEFYPQLMAASLSNLHSNRPHGAIFKRNFYSSLVDLLQNGSQNVVYKNHQLAKTLIDSLGCKTAYEFKSKVSNATKSLLAENARINSVLRTANSYNSSLRCEIRLSYRDLADFGAVFANSFTHENLQRHVFCIKTQTACKLAQNHIAMLTKPILFWLKTIVDSVGPESDGNTGMPSRFKLHHAMLNICVFENLLSCSLFSGINIAGIGTNNCIITTGTSDITSITNK